MAIQLALARSARNHRYGLTPGQRAWSRIAKLCQLLNFFSRRLDCRLSHQRESSVSRAPVSETIEIYFP